MPVPKKRITSASEAAKVESSDHKTPDEQEFRHYLQNLAISAMQVLIEEVKIKMAGVVFYKMCAVVGQRRWI